MSILTEDLPNSVFINGEEHKIDMSFDNIIKIYDMLSDDELTDYEQIVLGIQMLFDKQFHELSKEENITLWVETFKALMNNKEEDNYIKDIKGNIIKKKDDGSGVRLVDFIQDADYIYASFMKDYGIDLNKERGKMHYYKFRSLFNGLSSETIMMKIIDIRQRKIDPKLKGEDRRQLEKAKKQYALK